MLLTKLKVTACFGVMMLLAGVGATGLTYRATAQQPKQEFYYRSLVAARQAPDDLESLRLEMEALRKELRATRERVKTLEDEVRTLKVPGGMRRPGGRTGGRGGDAPPPGPGGGPPGAGIPPGSGNGVPGGTGNYRREGSLGDPNQPPLRVKLRESPSDPVTDAEAALKKLRRDPTDQKAAEELERALKRLKEREKSRPLVEDRYAPKR